MFFIQLWHLSIRSNCLFTNRIKRHFFGRQLLKYTDVIITSEWKSYSKPFYCKSLLIVQEHRISSWSMWKKMWILKCCVSFAFKHILVKVRSKAMNLCCSCFPLCPSAWWGKERWLLYFNCIIIFLTSLSVICLGNEKAESHPNMNIKVSTFIVTKKFYNIPFKIDTYSLDCLIFSIAHIICTVDWLQQFGIRLNVSSITQDHTVWRTRGSPLML